nr:cytochrome P450 [Spodoptera frugiperda]
MILFLVSVVLVLVLLVSWISLVRESHRFNVNGPMPLPIIGNAHMFISKSTEFLNLLAKYSEQYGKAYRVHFLSVPYVIICDAKYAQDVASSQELIFKGGPYSLMTCWLGQGLLTSAGQRWKSHRKFLTPAFHFNILQNFLPVFCKNQRVLTEKLRGLADGRPIDMFPIVALAALDNVTESIMGTSVDAQGHESESAYVKSIEEMSAILAMRIQIPILGPDAIFNLTPMKNRQIKALKVLHGHSTKVIETRRQELKKANITTLDTSNDTGIRNKHAFLDLLLLGEIDGKKIDDESVREEVDTFMFEGHDTTTSGISYTLYCLSKRRDVQEKVYEELKTIFGDDMERDPTYQELGQMKYLELVLKESMRLYPPVPLIERRITRDCEVGGLKLVKGTSVVLNIYQIQRQPDMFEDPLEFRPERFEEALKNPFSFLAFSAGPRNCIGQKFAMMELKITISEIVKHFYILPVDETPQLSADLILRSKNGINVKFMPRK